MGRARIGNASRFLLLFGALALAVACSGHTTGFTPNPGPTGAGGKKIGRGAFFVPVVPPFSPNTPHTIRVVSPSCARCPRSAPSPGPQSDHWFYLVNGYQLQTPIPGQPGSAPVPATPPYVLAVTGPLPQSAPGPNGGVTAGTVALGSGTQANQLWKLVQVNPGSTSPTQQVYLRSSQSFSPLQPSVGSTPLPSVNPPPYVYPSLLTGYGAHAVNLDLGAFSSASTPAVYLNQQTAPFNGTTTFQQWYYQTSNQTINNAQGGVLAQTCAPAGASGGCVGLAPGAVAPTSRWYAYPNYLLSIVLAEPTPGPAFPQPSVTAAPNGAGTTDVNGELAAYYYISMKALSVATITGLPPCTIPNEPGPGGGPRSYGIRCTYINTNDTGYVQNCFTIASESAPTGAQPYNPTNASLTATVSAADWAVVSTQMERECNYAQGVMETFASYNDVLGVVFTGSSDAINGISTAVGATQTESFAPTTLFEGLVYTGLSTVGTPGGILANLMQASIDYAIARKSALANPITVTAPNLYKQLANAYKNNEVALGETSQAIVWNWKRLQQIGPLTYEDGPNGLGISNADKAAMESAAVAGYETFVLQTYGAQVYGLSLNPGQTSASIGAASYNTFAYSTYGSASGSYNVNVYCDGWSINKHCPSQGLMASPAPLPAQERFALFNGLNGWSAIPRASTKFQCPGTITVLFNGSKLVLSVLVSSTQGYLARPGVGIEAINSPGNGQKSSGSTGHATFVLPPFGYLPIYTAGAGGHANQLSMNVSITAGGAQVGGFTFGNSGCYPSNYMNATNVTNASGWSFLPAPQNGKYAYPGSNNMQAQLQSGGNVSMSVPSAMWLVIQNQ
jgi:hypothetical protein